MAYGLSVFIHAKDQRVQRACLLLAFELSLIMACDRRPVSAGTSTRSSVVVTCQATCAQLLVILGRVHAEAAGQALGSMQEACFNPEANNPPEGLTEHVAESMCAVAAASGCAICCPLVPRTPFYHGASLLC